MADCGDAFEEVEGVGGGGAREGLDEGYAGRGLRAGGVEALDAEWHCGGKKLVDGFKGREGKGALKLVWVEVLRDGDVLDVWQIDAVARDAKTTLAPQVVGGLNKVGLSNGKEATALGTELDPCRWYSCIHLHNILQ